MIELALCNEDTGSLIPSFSGLPTRFYGAQADTVHCFEDQQQAQREVQTNMAKLHVVSVCLILYNFILKLEHYPEIGFILK